MKYYAGTNYPLDENIIICTDEAEVQDCILNFGPIEADNMDDAMKEAIRVMEELKR